MTSYIMVRFDRSPALYEFEEQDKPLCQGIPIPQHIPTELLLGPFECFEFTYDTFKYTRPGANEPDYVGVCDAGLWYLEGEEYPFSDMCFFATTQEELNQERWRQEQSEMTNQRRGD